MEMDRVPPCSMQYSQQFYTDSRSNNHIDQKNLIDSFKAPKVHVNPNFRNGKSLVIHVNPRMHQNRKIHVNPKMMRDIAPSSKEPAKINDTPVNIDKFSRDGRLLSEEKKIQKSIHVNPKLMKKFSSIGRDNVEANSTSSMPALADCDRASLPVPSKINEIAAIDKEISSKTQMPRLMALSRRKLVRIGSNIKTTTAAANVHLPNSLRRLNRKSLSVAQVINTKKSANPPSVTKFNPIKNKYKVNAYKIDRTAVERRKRKKICVPDARIRNVNKGLVAIGGVMYQSSRTQLVRSDTSSSVHKKKMCSSSAKGDTFVMAKNGKKLHRLQAGKEGSNVTRYMISRNSINRRTIVKRVPNSIVQTSHKNVISYKAKQRSLQILRDKLRKNYIPCLLYRRFGYCAKHAKGTCPKLHDKKQVALCKNFLQGKCLLDDCPLSHDIGPEKMPTCKYFLEGCCIRDACPYLHVKVSPNTPLCAQFLRGYCADGNKCKQRHTYICPEYEKSGNCAKGKYCPYPHKLKSSAALVTKTRVMKNIRRSSLTKKISNNVPSKGVDNSVDSRKRYYDKASPNDKQLAEMRENILKQMKCMKASHGIDETSERMIENRDEITIDDDNDVEETDRSYDERPKRAPIGPLPAYIPIN